MDLELADIVLIRGHTLFSKVILNVLRIFQNDPVNFNHVLIVGNHNLGIEVEKEVRYVDLNKVLKKVAGYKIIRRIDLTDEQKKNIVKKAEIYLGQKYGYCRLFRQLLDQIFHTNRFTMKLRFKRHICSSLVAWSYYVVCGIKFNNINWQSVEPDDISDVIELNVKGWKVIIQK